jgi:ubiquinone/menaquinone biosynthesis C-methylase UbiE
MKLVDIHLNFRDFLKFNIDHFVLLKKNLMSSSFKQNLSNESATQQVHYDRVYHEYTESLDLPHTQEYLKYMDNKFLEFIGKESLGNVAEICCGTGEALKLTSKQYIYAIGIDISNKMLEIAADNFSENQNVLFIHGDALDLPIKNNSLDTVMMFGGIHHVNNRAKLFEEIFRILKPGGNFFYREPASDCFLWKLIRKIIYRFSSGLDHLTERPLTYEETVPLLEETNFINCKYINYTFIGFCIFMNSDILKFNKIFKFFPFIKPIVRLFSNFDDYITSRNCFNRIGLQVMGAAQKPC